MKSSVFSFRAFCLALFLLVEYSCLAPLAHAAKRPGAARPLQLENGELIVGTNPSVPAYGENAADRIVVGSLSQTFERSPQSSEGKLLWRESDSRSSLSNRALPDKKTSVFVSNRSGLEAIYIQNVNQKDSVPRRLVTLARNPVWLDPSTLLYESTRPGREGIYKILIPSQSDFSPPNPQLIFAKGGEAAVAPDGKLICVAARDEHLNNTQLYLMAADGSGGRAIPQTAGARHPAFSSNGDAIYFDAPAPQNDNAKTKAAAENPRVIWMLPLLSTPPTAQLLEVRAGAGGEVEIIGTAFSQTAGALQTELEIGAGDEDDAAPKNWKKIETRAMPISSGVLASWRPPATAAPSSWTLRLTIVDGDGDRAQSTLDFRYPLENTSQDSVILPSIFATQPARYGLDTAPQDTPKIPIPMPKIETPKVQMPRLAPAPVEAPDDDTAQPVMATATLPKPAVSTPIVPVEKPVAEKVQTTKAPVEQTVIEKLPAAEPLPLPAPVIRASAKTITHIAKPELPVRAQTRRARKPKPAPKPTPKPTLKPVPKPVFKPQPPKNSGGIPAQMKVGASVPVTVVLRNTGSRSWSSTSDSPVRLIYRWVETKTNIRQRWAVQWLSQTVAPGQSARLKFTLGAPTHAGEYILTYALVRLNPQVYDGQKYMPPPTKAADQRWPGEFGAVSFRIAVTP